MWWLNIIDKITDLEDKKTELHLRRITKTGNSTVGELFIKDIFVCYILEDPDRGLMQVMSLAKIKELKEYGKTAIPRGRYEIIISYSNRFKKLLPLLVDVPGFEGIRIHPGNSAKDTEGCLLPGTTKANDFVGGSKVAFDNLFKRLQELTKVQKVFIEVA